MDFLNAPDYFYARLVFERALAFIYFIAFTVALNQFPALLGEKGLLPVPRFLRYVNFKVAPSLFHWRYSDAFLKWICWTGMILSLALSFGLSERLPLLLHILIWLTLYFFYLSLTNVGQVFYGFGWESMLCEAGFFMAFMGPQWMEPSWIPILLLRWMLFRTEMGAGLIKIRGDACWKDFTALIYHHETQPMPNPLSRYFHHLPRLVLKGGVVFSHFVQLVAPFGLFLPQPVATVAGGLIIFHQFILVVGGNYSWLNWITIVLGVLALDWGGTLTVDLQARPLWFEGLLYAMGAMTLWHSRAPFMNLLAKRQKMNFCWNRWHLICAYGAFGSVTKKRFEIVVEGSHDGKDWKEYEFKAKPGNLKRRPPQFAPYHLRLDWLMWFLPFSVLAGEQGVYVMEQEEWFLRFVQKLFANDAATLKLIRHNPFPQTPPQFLRARYYHYQMTTRDEHQRSGDHWKRTLLGDYLPIVRKENFSELSMT